MWRREGERGSPPVMQPATATAGGAHSSEDSRETVTLTKSQLRDILTLLTQIEGTSPHTPSSPAAPC